MAGILDNKSRVLDTIVTALGRAQLAEGGIDISYVTFTDADTFYDADVHSGSADATKRIFFEATNLPQDNITFKSDEAGKLLSLGTSSGSLLKSGQLLNYSFSESSLLTGSSKTLTVLSGSEFDSAVNDLLISSPDNFKKLRIIATKDAIFNDGFALGPSNIVFTSTENYPLDNSQKTTDINDYPSMFHDARFSNLINFRYLPPIIKTDDKLIDKSDVLQTKNLQIGNYIPASSAIPLDDQTIETELKRFDKLGLSKSITIDPGTRYNNILGQFFEIGERDVSKLDILDYGKVKIDGISKQVFFLGKVIIDSIGVQKFIHIFTLVFE